MPGLPRAAWGVFLALLVAATHAQSVTEPAPGVLLVAADSMGDPRFSRSVVLLIKHDRTGSWGVIINKPTEVELQEILPAAKESGEPMNVYFGGPVEVERLVCLYRDGAGDGESGTGLPEVGWSDSKEVLGERLAEDPEGVRVYAGYAGWAPGQLSFEIANGGWKMIEGRPGNVFSDDPEHLWRRLSEALGGISI